MLGARYGGAPAPDGARTIDIRRSVKARAVTVEVGADGVRHERDALIRNLRADATDEGCDEPTCSCHAKRLAAIETLTALRRTEC